MPRSGKEWRPGVIGDIDRMVAQMVDEAIDGQRSITNYAGDDEGWASFVADRAWDVEKYRSIGFNSGYIASLLNLAEYGKVRISPALLERARKYVYGEW